MDQEIASLKLNINQLAAITDVHRQTVAARLKNIEPAAGSNSKLKLYLITDILTELMIPTVSTNLEDMPPSDRLAHWKAENERLKFEQDTGQLIPADEVAREFSLMAKAVVMVLETLPDILERDCALPPAAVSRVQTVIDDLRDQMAQKVQDAEQEEADTEEE
ncbi:uncharacterized protein DUF1441 [Yokenella regensburgei]|jgi:hypothetical protein|uniref:Uncharacterized protein DUF1441 n=1 Tax=Yokenella regensburgei TaxID=158877 RepID=A0ABX9S2D4_9ENTR|nr:DUF1441 family protein [Yokenella regensburgei]RKR64968.1 uncharacterized protein DUF1441 [Yokenella regensburgei]VFS14506.1 Protein of uncharacterised function (DUF1441) [Yokenella regensburgei]